MMRMFSCVVIAGACLMLSGCGKSGPGESAAGFFKAAAAGDTEKAKTFIAPADLASEGGQMLSLVLPKVKTAADEKKGLKSVTVVEEKIDGDKATVKLKMDFGDGTSETEDGKMKKVDGKWYLAMEE